MSKKTNGVKWNKDSKSKERRKRAIERLEIQLKSGKKQLRSTRLQKKVAYDDLSEIDITRINKELDTLKTRI